MTKRFLLLTGATVLSLVGLFSLAWALSPAAPIARADPECVEVDADILVDTTWISPCYRVMTNTIAVAPYATLTLLPPAGGMRVEFLSGTQLQVLGNIQALGSASRPITFTSASTSPLPGDWIGIILEDNGGSDRIQHSLIEYARTGIRINDEDFVEILTNTLRYNGGSGNRDGGIGGDTDNSRISNNTIYSCTNGIALNESYSNEIGGNTIYQIEHYGIALLRGLTGGGPDNRIAGNRVSACTGGGIRLEGGALNQVLANAIYLNPGGAVYLDGQTGTTVQGNSIFHNGGGSGYRAAVYVTNTVSLGEIGGNVIYDERAEAVEYAASNSGAAPAVDLNALCSVPSLELRNDDPATINALHDWWGVNTPLNGVHFSGPVVFTPQVMLALTGTADGLVTVSLRDADGHTAPMPPPLATTPPAPNPRRVSLATNWGAVTPTVVTVNSAGQAAAALIPGSGAPPTPLILTATAFCGYVVTDTVELPNLAITKTVAVTQVVIGGSLPYRIDYANTGGAAAGAVRITDTLPALTAWAGDSAPALGWTRLATTPLPIWAIASLAPGAHGSFVLTTTVNAPCGVTLTNRVAIGAATMELRQSDNQSSAGPVTVVGPDLTIAKTTTLAEVVPGGLLTYTVAYGNTGLAGAAGVAIVDRLPAWTTYLTNTSDLPCAGCTPGAGGPLTWTVGSLAPGAARTFTLVLRVANDAPVSQTLVNTATIAAPSADCNPNNHVAQSPPVHVVSNVDLVVIKDDDVGPTTPRGAPLSPDAQAALERLRRTAAPAEHRDFVYKGDLVTYTIAVVNVGSHTASSVVLTETLPLYTTYVGGGWTPVAGRTYTLALGAMAPGDGRIAYFVVRVDDPLPPGVDNLVNRVCGFPREPDAHPDDNCNYEDTPVQRLALRVSKSAPPCIGPGDAFEYTITYRNVSTATLVNVPLTDTLDAYVSYAGGPGWLCDGHTCRRTIPTVPPQVTRTLGLPALLSPSIPYTRQTTITNVIEIGSGNRFVLVTPIDTGPDLVVVKNDNVGPLSLRQRARWEELARRLNVPLAAAPLQGFVRPGDRITYTVLYLNDGVGAATNVVVTEFLSEHTHYVGGGWTPVGGGQYTWNVGTLAPGQGNALQFIVEIDDPFPIGVHQVINRVTISGGTECDLSNNTSVEETEVRTGTRLYVANRDSGTISIFDTTGYDHLATIPAGPQPFGMAVSGTMLYVANFEDHTVTSTLTIINTISNTVVGSAPVGLHPIHVAVYGNYVYVANHSGGEGVTVLDLQGHVVAQLVLDEPGVTPYGFFGVTVDTRRGLIYFTKRDFGGIGIYSLTPPERGLVFTRVRTLVNKPSSIVYDPLSDRVYVTFGLIDELRVYDPVTWLRLETIPTGHQDPTDPGYGGHGLAVLGRCVFVSNYLDESVTVVQDGSCVASDLPAGLPAGPYRTYLPTLRGNFTGERRIVTIPLGGRPMGMTAVGNRLFVTLPDAQQVVVIDTATLTVVDTIAVPGAFPHTALVVED